MVRLTKTCLRNNMCNSNFMSFLQLLNLGHILKKTTYLKMFYFFRLNPVVACISKMTLSPDITLEYPDNYHVDRTRAITWSQEKRADELRDTTLRFMEKMCTDIYTLVDKRDKKKVLVFNQSDEALVTFSVKVNRDEKEEGYMYEARIKNKSNWVSRVAKCEVLSYYTHVCANDAFRL